jgi:hypothetical protein
VFKDDKPIKSTDRVKVVQKPDDKDKDGVQVNEFLKTMF